MKHYVFILFIIFSLVGCRSNKNFDRAVQEGSNVNEQVSASRQQSTVSSEQKTAESKETQDEIIYTQEAHYREDGTLEHIKSETIDRRRRTATSEQLTANSEQSTDTQATSHITADQSRTIEEKEKSTTDSRPVQGSEWLWIVLGVAGILFIAFLEYKKSKK